MVEQGILREPHASLCDRQGYAFVPCVMSFIKSPSESPQYLANMVSRLFSPIPNRGQDPLPVIHEHPFGPNEMGVSHIFFFFSCGYSPMEPV